MARVHLDGAGDIEKLFNTFIAEIVEKVGDRVVDSVVKEINDVKVLCVTFEKYYFRLSSHVAVTVLLLNIEDYVDIEIMSAGGSEGLVLNLSEGAHESYISEIAEIFTDKGYRIIKDD
ncbi:DUF6054 family protein [Erysipelotrichaceae bacterium OttesenSCG-928-M19]|nr:DUF6054 family protein [Erysipelotrichaceae bacterium OttesenSCG-928-M19]